MNRIWTLASRELKALFDHPTGYILMIVFVAVNDFLFFRQAYLLGVASLRPMMDLLPWMFLFLVPAVTMRTLADDARSGTIEVVLAQPITELELLLGKYLGAVLFLWITLAATLAIPVALSFGADLHAGVVIAQYTGAALLAAGLAGVGVWTSSLTRNQITAFILGVAVMFVLVLVGLNPLIVGLPPTLGTLAARLGVLTHFSDIGRGVIDLRDVLYFATLAAVFLTLAYGALMSHKLAAKSEARKRLRLGISVLVISGIVVNLLGGYIRGRIDLTPGNAYTLSPATKQIVRGLDDLVTIRLFASAELPPEVSLLKRDLDDLLRDIRSASNGKVRIVETDPAGNEEAAREAQSLGVPPIQFNVIGQSQLQIKEGYLGLAVQFAEEVETIPVIRQTDDLEFRLASAIRGMTRTTQPVVGMVTGASNDMLGQLTFNELQTALREQYDLRTISLEQDSQPTSDLAVLVLAGNPDSLPPEQVERVRAFAAAGNGLFVMASGTQPNPMQGALMAVPGPVAWNDVLEGHGVSIRSDIAYDLRSNEAVSLPASGGFRVMTPYPFWVRALSTGQSIINQELQGVFLPWTSSVDTSGAAAGTVTPLFVTTGAARAYDIFTVLDPQREFRTDSLTTQLLAVQVNPPAAAGDSAPALGRAIVVGNGQFAADRHVRNAPENLVFALNAVDWLAQDDALIRIRSKDRRPPQLTMDEGAREAAKYANLIGIPLLIGLAGLGRLVRRRRITRQTWSPTAPPAPTAPRRGEEGEEI